MMRQPRAPVPSPPSTVPAIDRPRHRPSPPSTVHAVADGTDVDEVRDPRPDDPPPTVISATTSVRDAAERIEPGD